MPYKDGGQKVVLRAFSSLEIASKTMIVLMENPENKIPIALVLLKLPRGK